MVRNRLSTLLSPISNRSPITQVPILKQHKARPVSVATSDGATAKSRFRDCFHAKPNPDRRGLSGQ
jgi:hypothetical protein